MNHRVLLLGLVLVGGCAPSRAWVPTVTWPETDPSKSKPQPTDNEAASIGKPPGDVTTTSAGVGRPLGNGTGSFGPRTTTGPVDLAGAVGSPQLPTVPTPTLPPFPQPRELPPVTVAEASPQSGPHVRVTPTATGGILNLAPNEQPIDKVVDLARQLATAEDENRVLRARIRELEATGLSREQAIAEMVREVETATAEVTATQTSLKMQRAEVTALKARLRQMEEEDIRNLKELIEALEEFLKMPSPKRPSGKEAP